MVKPAPYSVSACSHSTLSKLETVVLIIVPPNRASTMNDQASTPAPSGSHDPNQHIYDFLDYYTDFAEPPKYAVLIDGPWGVGKTHLVKQYLLKKFGGRKREPYVYVSLFGVRSAAEIDDALYAKLHPLASSKGAKLVGRAVSIALKHGGYDIGNFTLRSLLKRKVDLYIFDALNGPEWPQTRS
jgi:hypothetical protein